MTATLSTSTSMKAHRVAELREVLPNYFVTPGDAAKGRFGAKARTACGRTYEGLVSPEGGPRGVTCDKCQAAEETAPLAVVTADGTETTVEVAPTAAVHTFTASADNRRRCTCGSTRNAKIHGYSKTARLTVAEVAAIAADRADDATAAKVTVAEAAAIQAEEAPVDRAAQAIADARAHLAAHPELVDDELAAELAEKPAPARTLGQMEPEERAAVVAKAVAQLQEELTAAAPAIARVLEEDTHPAAVTADSSHAPKLVSVWVGWRIADRAIALVDADVDAATASVARKLRDRPMNKVLDRTVRLSYAECQALAAIATDVENAALADGSDPKERGPLVYSARTLRGRMAAAWA